MEIHQLRYVIAVAECGSFSRAAERLYVGQSNVSMQVRKLEAELGAPLFERRARNVVLTVYGRAFLPRARQTLGSLEEARAAIDATRGLKLGHVDLGVIGTLGGWLLPELVAQFHRSHPLIHLRLVEEPTQVLTSMVASRELPQAIVNFPVERTEQLEGDVLFREELVLVVPPDHKSRGLRSIRLESFADEEWILPEVTNILRTQIMQLLNAAGIAPRCRIEVTKKQLMQDLLLGGIGVGLLPRLTAEHFLASCPDRIVAVEPAPTRSVGVIRHRGSDKSPADHAIAKVLREVVRKRVEKGGGGLHLLAGIA